MLSHITVFFILTTTFVLSQRPFFAGLKPIGFPDLPNRTTEDLGNRFGEVNGTTPKIPIEANGDWDLIDRLSKLPIDKQPFWFLNWQAIEANRQKPQTYPQRPNEFIDPVPTNQNSASKTLLNSNSPLTSNSGNDNSNLVTTNSGINKTNFGSSNENNIFESNISNLQSDISDLIAISPASDSITETADAFEETTEDILSNIGTDEPGFLASKDKQQTNKPIVYRYF